MDKIKEFKTLFISTLTIANKLSNRFDSKNVAEAIMIGIASNIETLINKDSNVLDGMCADLLRLPMFSSEEIKEGLGSEDKVKGRIKSAIEVFSCG